MRKGLRCPTYEPILDMTLPQLANIARGGKPPRGPELGAMSGAEFRRRLMERAGLDPDAPPAPLDEEVRPADG